RSPGFARGLAARPLVKATRRRWLAGSAGWGGGGAGIGVGTTTGAGCTGVTAGGCGTRSWLGRGEASQETPTTTQTARTRPTTADGQWIAGSADALTERILVVRCPNATLMANSDPCRRCSGIRRARRFGRNRVGSRRPVGGSGRHLGSVRDACVHDKASVVTMRSQ